MRKGPRNSDSITAIRPWFDSKVLNTNSKKYHIGEKPEISFQKSRLKLRNKSILLEMNPRLEEDERLLNILLNRQSSQLPQITDGGQSTKNSNIRVSPKAPASSRPALPRDTAGAVNFPNETNYNSSKFDSPLLPGIKKGLNASLLDSTIREEGVHPLATEHRTLEKLTVRGPYHELSARVKLELQPMPNSDSRVFLPAAASVRETIRTLREGDQSKASDFLLQEPKSPGAATIKTNRSKYESKLKLRSYEMGQNSPIKQIQASNLESHERLQELKRLQPASMRFKYNALYLNPITHVAPEQQNSTHENMIQVNEGFDRRFALHEQNNFVQIFRDAQSLSKQLQQNKISPSFMNRAKLTSMQRTGQESTKLSSITKGTTKFPPTLSNAQLLQGSPGFADQLSPISAIDEQSPKDLKAPSTKATDHEIKFKQFKENKQTLKIHKPDLPEWKKKLLRKKKDEDPLVAKLFDRLHSQKTELDGETPKNFNFFDKFSIQDLNRQTGFQKKTRQELLTEVVESTLDCFDPHRQKVAHRRDSGGSNLHLKQYRETILDKLQKRISKNMTQDFKNKKELEEGKQQTGDKMEIETIDTRNDVPMKEVDPALLKQLKLVSLPQTEVPTVEQRSEAGDSPSKEGKIVIKPGLTEEPSKELTKDQTDPATAKEKKEDVEAQFAIEKLQMMSLQELEALENETLLKDSQLVKEASNSVDSEVEEGPKTNLELLRIEDLYEILRIFNKKEMEEKTHHLMMSPFEIEQQALRKGRDKKKHEQMVAKLKDNKFFNEFIKEYDQKLLTSVNKGYKIQPYQYIKRIQQKLIEDEVEYQGYEKALLQGTEIPKPPRISSTSFDHLKKSQRTIHSQQQHPPSLSAHINPEESDSVSHGDSDLSDVFDQSRMGGLSRMTNEAKKAHEEQKASMFTISTPFGGRFQSFLAKESEFRKNSPNLFQEEEDE